MNVIWRLSAIDHLSASTHPFDRPPQIFASPLLEHSCYRFFVSIVVRPLLRPPDGQNASPYMATIRRYSVRYFANHATLFLDTDAHFLRLSLYETTTSSTLVDTMKARFKRSGLLLNLRLRYTDIGLRVTVYRHF